MNDRKIKTGVVFMRNGLWQVEVETWEYTIADQFPNHNILCRGFHENRRIKIEILNSTEAKFLEFCEK